MKKLFSVSGSPNFDSSSRASAGPSMADACSLVTPLIALFWMNLRLKAKNGANWLWRAWSASSSLRDAEEFAEKILDVRGERDDQLGLIFGSERGGIRAGVEKTCA